MKLLYKKMFYISDSFGDILGKAILRIMKSDRNRFLTPIENFFLTSFLTPIEVSKFIYLFYYTYIYIPMYKVLLKSDFLDGIFL